MDSKLLYLKQRTNFHRRMTRRATCGEARCAHQAFVRAYLDRIGGWISEAAPSRATEGAISRAATGPVVLSAAKPELVG